jgi:hypothetical protein
MGVVRRGKAASRGHKGVSPGIDTNLLAIMASFVRAGFELGRMLLKNSTQLREYRLKVQLRFHKVVCQNLTTRPSTATRQKKISPGVAHPGATRPFPRDQMSCDCSDCPRNRNRSDASRVSIRRSRGKAPATIPAAGIHRCPCRQTSKSRRRKHGRAWRNHIAPTDSFLSPATSRNVS